MDRMIEELAAEKAEVSGGDYRQALRETLQQLVISSLAQTDFFDHSAFYGGTALRIFYGLDRFSEDLDFSLLIPEESFDFESYLPEIETLLNQAGITVKVGRKYKMKASNIESAFLKTNTYAQILSFFPCASGKVPIHKDEIMKIKIEIDTNPPAGADFEWKMMAQPYPCLVRLYDGPSLFAGKIAAVLTRAWKTRTKGRDLYDYLFYIQRGVPINLHHLTRRLIQSNVLPEDSSDISLEAVKDLLRNKFSAIDFKEAAQDPLPFLRKPNSTSDWSEEFFLATLDLLKAS